ncbi:MAG: DNA mismatch repair endonuclease MutL [Nitrospinota bacterium]
MSGVITILPESLSNILAAGEVVERPASVVKELVENSIDSGANRVIVQVKGGGRRSLVISDNGRGMGQEDAILSIQRHATSKILSERDLFSIKTYGFRGEALASIASVSNMKIVSCLNGAGAGTVLVAKGGDIVNVKEAPPVAGTSIEIKDLFFNVPARLKFLKSDGTEVGHINRAVVSQALARHSIGFHLTVDSRTVHDFPPAETSFERIAAISGSEISQNLIAVSENKNGLSLTGFVSNPVYTRRSKNHQYIFLNSRSIRDKTISRAVFEAFKNVIPRDRHPVFYLYLDIAPGAVDVNVHPAKLEVRFSRANEVFDFVYHAVKKSLSGMLSKNTLPLASPENPFSCPNHFEGSVSQSDFTLEEKTDASSGGTQGPEARKPLFLSPPLPDNNVLEKRELFSDSLFQALSPKELRPEDSLDPLSIKVSGQLFNSLIIIESGNRMFLIDQHAAHERVLFERVLTRVRQGTMEVQELLFPVHIELSSAQQTILARHGKELESLGVSVEGFGGNTCVIRSLPVLLSKEDPKEVFMDFLDILCEKKGKESYETMLNRLIQTAACRSAVKAGQALEPAEMKSIVSTLFSEEVLATCPHGRPFMVSMEKDSIMRKFLRS